MARRVADAAMSRLQVRIGTKVAEAGGRTETTPRNYASTRLNARGEACQPPASAGGGGLGEAGSATARNPHAGAAPRRRIPSARNTAPKPRPRSGLRHGRRDVIRPGKELAAERL